MLLLLLLQKGKKEKIKHIQRDQRPRRKWSPMLRAALSSAQGARKRGRGLAATVENGGGLYTMLLPITQPAPSWHQWPATLCFFCAEKCVCLRTQEPRQYNMHFVWYFPFLSSFWFVKINIPGNLMNHMGRQQLASASGYSFLSFTESLKYGCANSLWKGFCCFGRMSTKIIFNLISINYQVRRVLRLKQEED